eukprot:g2732.t1
MPNNHTASSPRSDGDLSDGGGTISNTNTLLGGVSMNSTQRKWPALFFLLRKAEFSRRIRAKILERTDADALLNFVHPDTHETCLILGGLFSGKEFLLEMLSKMKISTACANAVSNLCAAREKTCATCLANFFEVGCKEGFEKILARNDLEPDMLVVTHRYLSYFLF